MPAVSVVIPVYNDAAHMRRSLSSVFAQSMGDYEVIVVDDGSSDDLDAVLAAVPDKRLRVLRHEHNRGTAAARNTGIRAARGKFIAFLDADDEWMHDKLAMQIFRLRASDDCHCCYTGYYRHRKWDQRTIVHYGKPSENWYRRLQWGCDLSPGSTLMVRAAAFDEVGVFDEDLPRLEDWDWLLRYTAHHDIAVVEKPLAIVHSQRVPSFEKVVRAIEMLRDKHLSRLGREDAVLRRQFRSSVLIELASARFHQGNKPKAIEMVARSLAIYPFRNWRFLWNIMWRAVNFRMTRMRPEPSRVMHVITGLGIGGAETMLAGVVRRTRSEGTPPVVVSLFPGGELAGDLTKSGIRVIDLGMRPKRPSVVGIFRMARLIRRERPDLIQSWMYHADLVSLLGLWLSGRRRRTRIFWGVRCSELDFGDYTPLLRRTVHACALLARWPDGVIFNSYEGMKAHLRSGYRPRQLMVIDNGVDTTRFTPDAEARRAVRKELDIPDAAVTLALVARVDPMKGHEVFLEAFRRLDNVHAMLIGTGTEALPDRPRMHCLGPRPDVARLLAAADIIVSSSRYGEGFSNAIAEGMAVGLPAVVTNVGDSGRIVGEAGIVVPPNTPGALADAIRKLSENAGLRKRLGAKARARIVDNFTMERTVDAFRAAYGIRPTEAGPSAMAKSEAMEAKSPVRAKPGEPFARGASAASGKAPRG